MSHDPYVWRCFSCWKPMPRTGCYCAPCTARSNARAAFANADPGVRAARSLYERVQRALGRWSNHAVERCRPAHKRRWDWIRRFGENEVRELSQAAYLRAMRTWALRANAHARLQAFDTPTGG